MKHSISRMGSAAMLLLAIVPRLQAAEVAPAALPVLEETFLRDGSWSHAPSLREQRLLALEAVAKIDEPGVVPTLLVATGDWEPAVRAEAQRQLLESRGVTLADIRRQWLLSDDWFWRQGAIRTLLDHGVTADELAREVAALVENPSSDQRLAAAAALKNAADDPAWYVADEARRALRAIVPDEPPRPRSAPAAIDDSPSVTVEDRGATLFLQNGLVSCEVEKATGDLVTVRRAGDARNLLGAKGRWYASFPWTLPRGTRRPQWADRSARIVRHNDELAEVAIRLRLDAPRPLTQEQRFVMRRGVSGVYQFAVFRKPEESRVPPGVTFDYGRFDLPPLMEPVSITRVALPMARPCPLGEA